MKANWLRAAMSDDNLVAELLLCLNRPDSRPPRRAKPALPLPPTDWGMRQPRSKAAASLKKEQEARRRSPTTPLSWTASGFGSGGGASPSDSFEESSRPIVLASRFKGSVTPDTTNSDSASKRSRRKRTFAELKEEESSLLKNREHLNKQLESLHMKLEEQRSFNENLKRIKFDLHSHSAAVNQHMGPQNQNNHPGREASTPEAASNVSKKVKSEEISMSHNLCSVLNTPSNEQPTIFVLPDLNMMPGEDLGPEMR